ncbi:MAG TPA: dephospho-CoA kinase [Bacteroidia bacterium]
MIRLGVTGGIGSGKTTVCAIFEHLGVPVYYADIRAKQLVDQDPEIKQAIINEFGQESFKNNIYNRSFIASIVFNDRSKLEKLNDIIHPAVLNDWNKFCQQHSQLPYVVKEAAIMLETDSKNSIDEIALVFAPLDLRIKRVSSRDGSTEAEIMARINAQMPEEEKLKLADYVIINDEKNSLIEQVMSLHHKFVDQ